MAKTTLPAHQERSRETLERLLKSATEVLDKEGLEAATIPRIAAHAGVTPGAIYRRFPDKDALLREVCLRMMERNRQHVQESLTPERFRDMSLAEICKFVIETTLNGHAKHRGLLRALLFFTQQHPDAAFVRRSEEAQWEVFRAISDLLLTRRSEMRHPDPDSAVPFALMMVGVTAKGVMIVPRSPKNFSRILPDVEERLRHELPRMMLRYLGAE